MRWAATRLGTSQQQKPLYPQNLHLETRPDSRIKCTYLLLDPLGGVQVGLDQLEGFECFCLQQGHGFCLGSARRRRSKAS